MKTLVLTIVLFLTTYIAYGQGCLQPSNPWGIVDSSETWDEWIPVAENMMRVLLSLEEDG